MEVSLKDFNRLWLALVVVGNVVVYYAVLSSGFDLQNLMSMLREYESYAPSTIVALIVGVLNAQLDHETKAHRSSGAACAPGSPAKGARPTEPSLVPLVSGSAE